MRCKLYNCVNNDNGYCCVDSYIEIEEDGTCSEAIIKNDEKEDKTDELKPCPFCGGRAMVCEEYAFSHDDYNIRVYVKCYECNVSTKAFLSDTMKWNPYNRSEQVEKEATIIARAKAIKAWNSKKGETN